MKLLQRRSTLLPENHSHQVPSHRDLVLELGQFAKSSTRRGVTLFVLDYALFWGAIAAVMFLPSLPLKVLASLIAGVKLANLATLAHDAAHNSLTRSRKLNWTIAVLAFLPGLFNYRMWVYDHHSLHHPHTNGAHVDSYQPLSKAAYDALSPFQRAWHRFTRSGNPLAFSLYYIIERWAKVKFMPRAFLPKAMVASAWKHSIFLLSYLAGFMTLLLNASEFAPISAVTAVLLCLVLPFMVFQGLLAFSLYINHTHPEIPWFNSDNQPVRKLPAEALTLHLRFPAWFATLAHHFYDHPAHHAYPAIPCYELGKAQAKMNQLLGARALVLDFSFSAVAAIFRQCQLYDYENHCWLDYSGQPSSLTARCILESAPVFSPSFALEH